MGISESILIMQLKKSNLNFDENILNYLQALDSSINV